MDRLIPVIAHTLRRNLNCKSRHYSTHVNSFWYLSWCTVQHSHGFCHSLYSCGVGKVREQAIKLWVPEDQVKQTVCIQLQLINRVLQRRKTCCHPLENDGSTSISTHWGDVEASTVTEVPQQLLHEQHLQVKAANHHTGVLKGLIVVHLWGEQ